MSSTEKRHTKSISGERVIPVKLRLICNVKCIIVYLINGCSLVGAHTKLTQAHAKRNVVRSNVAWVFAYMQCMRKSPIDVSLKPTFFCPGTVEIFRAVVLNLGSIESHGFDESVPGVRRTSRN